MADAIRYQRGKKSVTDSENELNFRRKVKKPKIFKDTVDESNDELTQNVLNDEFNTTTNSSLQSCEQPQVPSLNSCAVTNAKLNTATNIPLLPRSPRSLPSFEKAQVPLKDRPLTLNPCTVPNDELNTVITKTSLSKKPGSLPSIPVAMKQKAISSNSCRSDVPKCKINKRHICTYSTGNGILNFETIADTLCVHSKHILDTKHDYSNMTESMEILEFVKKGSITLLRNAMQDGIQEILSVMKNKNDSNDCNNTQIEGSETEDFEEVQYIKNIFPLTCIKELEEFDQKLLDENFQRNAISAISSFASRCHSSARATTNILRAVLHPEVVSQYTWKGQKRFGMKKKCFCETKICQIIVDTVSRRWRVDKDRVEKSVSSWLAQVPHQQKQEKKGKSSSSPTDKTTRVRSASDFEKLAAPKATAGKTAPASPKAAVGNTSPPPQMRGQLVLESQEIS